MHINHKQASERLSKPVIHLNHSSGAAAASMICIQYVKFLGIIRWIFDEVEMLTNLTDCIDSIRSNNSIHIYQNFILSMLLHLI